MTSRTVGAAMLVVVLMLAGCGIGEAGMPLPRQEAGESYPGERQELRGTLTVSDFGCFNMDTDAGRFFVIWPSGSDYDDGEDGYARRLPGGEVLIAGSPVTGTGARPLLLERDSSLAYAIRGCAPDASEVVVFDTARQR